MSIPAIYWKAAYPPKYKIKIFAFCIISKEYSTEKTTMETQIVISPSI